jgi:hypothetical protein
VELEERKREIVLIAGGKRRRMSRGSRVIEGY